MNLRKRIEEESTSSGEMKRPKRSCVVEAEKRKTEKEEDIYLIHHICSLFEQVVSDYFNFLIDIQYLVDKNSTDLSYQRKFDELHSELYTFCNSWRNEIELSSLCFYQKRLPNKKTNTIYFNYENPKMFINKKSFDELEREYFRIVPRTSKFFRTFQRKYVSPKMVHNEIFYDSIISNNICERYHTFCKNKVFSKYIKNLSVIKYDKKENEEECSICLDDFKLKEVLYKLPCKHIYHRKCLQKSLKISTRCPTCNHILS